MKNRSSKPRLLTTLSLTFLIASVTLCPRPAPGAAASLVYNNDDSGPGSLRQAIDDSNHGLANTILFSNIVTGTITLLSGQLLISNSVSIVGPGNKVLSVSGNNSSRVFEITNNATVNISGLTIANGDPPLVATLYGRDGGAILLDSGALTLGGCTISSNRATSVFSGIPASGGALLQNAGLFTASNCTFSGNVAKGSAGAISQNGGALVLVGCTLAGNMCSNRLFGGAMVAGPGLGATLNNCTFFGNQGGEGGAVYNAGILTISNCTFSGNLALYHGGGISQSGAAPTVRNTIIAGNSALVGGQDCSGSFTSGGFNLVGITNDSSGWGSGIDQAGSSNTPLNALLGSLQDNGGPTLTIALLPGSPAIDQGNSGGSTTTDQRGAPRPFEFASIADALGGDGSDIGAIELGSPRLNIQQLNTNVAIYWPAYYGGSTLQSTTNLAGSTYWSNLPGTPAVIGNQFYLIDAAPRSSAFYRLIFP